MVVCSLTLGKLNMHVCISLLFAVKGSAQDAPVTSDAEQPEIDNAL